jgi:transglutaminase-like putative cysteine protease
MTSVEVRHTTIYRYRRPVILGEHVLLSRPRDSHEIRLIRSKLDCSPAATTTWSFDVFGNCIARLNFSAPTSVLEITSTLLLDLFAPEWPVFSIRLDAQNYPFQYSADERTDLGALRNLQYADARGQLQAWAKRFVRGKSTDTLSLLKDLNAGVFSSLRYQSRDEEGTQGPLETLARGVGTCRDYAVLMAEAARTLGFAARLASGYLHQPQTGAWVGGGSTHAWVEIYIPGAGWIAFDPTNNVMGSAHLIPVAVARNIQQVAPVTGSFTGVPDDMTGLSVSVTVSDVVAAPKT